MAEDYTNVVRIGTVLLDPETGQPYKASFSTTTVEGDFDPTGLATEAKQDSQVAAVNGVTTRLGETLNVHVVDPERPLATGAATSAKQDSQITRLNDIYNLLGAGIEVTESRATTPVSADSLPLPAGAATSAKQDAVIARLNAALVAEVTNTVAVTMANRNVTVDNAVQIANTEFAVTPKQGATFPVSGTVAVSNPSFPVTGTVAVSSIGAPVPITDNGGSVTVDGQVGVSGGTITVDNTALPLPTGASTAALQTALNSSVGTGNASLASIDGKMPALGQAAKAASVPVSLASDQGNLGVTVSNFPATQPVSGTVTANTPAPSASASGLTAYRNQSLSSTPAAVKTSQGRVYGYHFANPNTSWVYLHFYNALVANVTVGTTAPIASFGIPANAVLDGYWSLSDVFGTAITIAVTTSPLNTVATAPTTAILAQLAYI